MSADELERAYRAEATRIRALLARRLGDVGLAEELVQDAFVEALEHWQADGLPANPGGWLATGPAWLPRISPIRRPRPTTCSAWCSPAAIQHCRPILRSRSPSERCAV